jgi:SAM-dependent methyltransferase
MPEHAVSAGDELPGMTTARLAGADKWGSFYAAGTGSVFPDESLVRLFRGAYADLPRKGRVLDVGFGTGNNLVMIAQSGYDAHGLEVAESCLDAARAHAAASGVSLTLGVLEGTALPYPDGHFDIVLSWNAVYYYGRRRLVDDAIADFHRVLREGGVLLLSVPHPNNVLTRRLSEDLGDGRHRIEKAASIDNRQGSEIFYEPTSSGWRRLLNRFDEVEEGYAEADLFNPGRRLAWRLFLARKLTA